MNSNLLKSLVAVLIAIGAVNVVAHSASADDFQKKHPRRAEVNKRERNQKNQVKQGEANGTLTQKQGNKIDRQENRTKQIEHRDERQNERDGRGDTLTKGQQNQINNRENHTEGEIKRDENHNQNSGGGAPAGGAPAAPAPAAGQ